MTTVPPPPPLLAVMETPRLKRRRCVRILLSTARSSSSAVICVRFYTRLVCVDLTTALVPCVCVCRVVQMTWMTLMQSGRWLRQPRLPLLHLPLLPLPLISSKTPPQQMDVVVQLATSSSMMILRLSGLQRKPRRLPPL